MDYSFNKEIEVKDELLKNSEERYRLALLGANDGIWDWDIKKGEYHNSKKFMTLLDYPTEDTIFLNNSWQNLIYYKDLEKVQWALDLYLKQQTPKYKCEYRIKKKDGSFIWILDTGVAIWDENGIPIRMAGSHTDITKRKMWEEHINKLAFYDTITDLPNRSSLNIELKKLMLEEDKFSLVFIDIDNFKSINEAHGHSFGDELLKKVTERFKVFLNNSHKLYRWSGDEFIFLITNINSLKDIQEFIINIRKLLNTSIFIRGNELYITVSIGASIFPDDSKTPEELIQNADIAMHYAKSIRKNNYKIYNKQIYIQNLSKLTLEQDLQDAVKNKHFKIAYQPQYDIKTESINGMEALVRWVTPDNRVISPADFIPIAEETGLIIPISEYVFEKACIQNKLWQDKGYRPIKIAVNLSAKQFESKNLVRKIIKILKKTNLSPKYLELEVTESMSMKNPHRTSQLLASMRKLGISVALDDFGTGYSSLNYLKMFPVNKIKIDKSFIDKVTENSKESHITKSLIALAHDLDFKIIAEGIETKEQLQYLKINNCDEGQGYYFNKPMYSNEMEELLKYHSQ
ncbi:phytochrome-like protein cph2 [Clostridium homopropionicum DSM 5847]|uniref:Phytochrome-like protein cph2 n=1 Tax=Clostridium homopropionicum DSM 5847 TaxID=1121318 RepID=A0A0L6Z7G8_9CLOT|nr:GGDEF and EAL domain-containing protein [Clostridium homopropionicum]KOA18909.1 phytochrome-like protein cph2 [Clostridium homopropionicum DSM 5847]SFG44818.1 PAS domain S-box-containing protein/diguanylate cyclase (GGDEF) domain-containing protein [Clostridium homopropionicum]